MKRYLTKSKFQLALECPTKLFYDGKPEYANHKLEDPFLLALAEGGFQVGELAKCYFSEGIEVDLTDYEMAEQQTKDLLKREKVIIFEAVIKYRNMLLRSDILIKNGNQVELIEVKSKSIDPTKGPKFKNRYGFLSTEWQPYFFDVAFQKHVLCSAFPEYNISAFLMLVDKSAKCPTDGLNQKFRIERDEKGRKHIVVSPNLNKDDIATPILTRVNVDDICDMTFRTKMTLKRKEVTFIEYMKTVADCYAKDEKILSPNSTICATCEYKATEEEMQSGLKSGYHECWKDMIQLAKSPRVDQSCWIDKENLKNEMSRWIYPLHFIDFETSMVAIPFNKGRHPYEGIAFQFSHHVVYEDGEVEHRGEYLNTRPGIFPNYEFVRKLKEELEKDNGSIFRYAAHENTYLNIIYRQLVEDPESIPDREELCRFIKSITKSINGSKEKWEGQRCMIDMLQLVRQYYSDTATNGSNSLKVILPSILNNSSFLQSKYSKPIYGAKGGIKSLNYENQTWVVNNGGIVLDPYKLLPPIFHDIPEKECELLSGFDVLRDGGAASMAYARMQFEEMSEYERSEITKALLKYCELDTLAMVMLYEGWKDLIEKINIHCNKKL